MKVTIKNTAHIGMIIKMARLSQDLDQFSAASLSGVGQSFLSHIENGKETAQIGKVLDVLTTLGVRIELALPLDVDVDAFRTLSGSGKDTIRAVMGDAEMKHTSPVGYRPRLERDSDIPAPDADQVFEYMDKIKSTRVKRP
ncbi:helix-turn-helix domain-containing protein [Alkalimonas collagenimarina]|uniref:Helix-turn-helix domain-containing protein n=1 Tax=Alkalimonas collagenimarina TaxID=400390 RepID=A0ABT9H185_9GAMM|nr:helix-turn-helix domain-containing protein [Alkalimonas collagenimarina]MDP4537063.1 helix-turn-helix domain-containing protein [Alkalimonas collagenimarina]